MSEDHISLPQPILDKAPCGMAMLDNEGRLSWANDRLGQMVGMPVDQLLGQAPNALPANAARLLEGETGLLQLAEVDGNHRWFQRDFHKEADKAMVILLEVTEQQRLDAENSYLRQQLADLKLNDDLTGLPNKRAITQALELQITRSRRYQNPLSVVMVHIGLDDEQIHALHAGADPLILGVSRFLRDRLRWVDQIGRWEDNIFVLVLPETELEDAQGLIEKIRNEQSSMRLPEPFENVHPVLSFGVSRWQKGDDLRTLLRQVTRELMDD